MQSNATILVVDNEPSLLQAMNKALKKAGYKVIKASNGEAGLRLAKKRLPDLMIVDVMLPDMDGVEVCQRVMEDPDLKGIMTVLVSSIRKSSDALAGRLKEGIHEYIARPMANQEFLDSLEARIREKRARETLQEALDDVRKGDEKQALDLARVEAALQKEIFKKDLAQKNRMDIEEDLQAIFTNAPICIFLADEEGRLHKANPALANLFEQTIDGIIGHRCGFAFKCIHMLDDPAGCGFGPYCQTCNIRNSIVETIRTGIPHVRTESKLTCRHGKELYEHFVSISTSAVRIGGQKRVLVCMEDITKRKRAEEALLENEARYWDLVEESHAMIYTHDLAGNILSVNEWAAKFLRVEQNKILGTNVRDILVPEKRDQFDEYLAVIRSDGFAQGLMLIRTANGEKRIWEYHNTLRTKGVKVPIVRGIAFDVTEFKRVEKALRLSEEKFSKAFQARPTWLVISSLEDGRFIEVNDAYLKSMGFTREEVIGKTAPELGMWANPEDRGRIISELKEKGSVREREIKRRRKSGELIDILFSAEIVEIGGEKCMLSTSLDITERKRAEEALRATEAKYRKLYESMMDGFVYVDMNGVIRDCNETYQQMLGYSPDELSKLTYQDLTLEKWHAFEEEIVKEQILPRGFSDVYEKEYRKKDGTIFPVELRTFLVKNYAGEDEGMWAIVRDITERKRAEQSLVESERRFRAIFEQAGVGVAEIDSVRGRYLSVNQKYCEITGHSQEEMLTMNFMEITLPDDLHLDLDNMQRLIRGEISTFTMEKRYRRKNGEVVWVNLIVSPLWISSDTRKGLTHLAIVEDITKRKRAEQEMAVLQEQLRHSQKLEAIGVLTGGIAHDFNNIMTIISGSAQLLLLDIKEGGPLKRNLEEIRRAAERATDLTRRLLAFSRKQILEVRVLNLNEVLQRFDKMLRRVIGEDIQLEVIATESLGKVKADSGQIEQVIMNLVVNARDAMPGGGKLTIETANVELDEGYARTHIGVSPGPYVMLSVSDTGKGMTQEIKERIFEPFFTTKEKGKGTGLGLSTVYGIVKQSEGNIWVYSELNQGTTIKIYLPRVEGVADELKEEVIEEIPVGSETVLVVEDEGSVRRLAVMILKKQGYQVLEAANGRKAIMLCEKYKEPINIILTDVVMPGMSGRELSERLQKIHPEARVLFMSGYTDNAIVHHGILDPGIQFLQKPFTVETLTRKVREVLDKS